MEFLATLWNVVVFGPMLNTVVFLYTVFGNFGVAIILFTLVVRAVMLPLTIKQLYSTKKMSDLQPRLQELQRKYPKDRPRISQETMRLYKEAGINPLGCLGPIVVQFPIWIGLYQAIIQAMPPDPEGLISVSSHLYPWLPLVHQAIPVH
ncbi:MAG: membrane protein insertase YidC, partial [Chloroflexota bacterium]